MSKVPKDESKEKKEGNLRALKRMLVNVLTMLVILWAGFTFFIGVTAAKSDDMKPRIGEGDVLIYYRLDKNPVAQDVIVFTKNGTEYVGRVVAAGGDRVEITKEAALIINGNMVIEDGIYYSTPPYEGFVEYPLTLAGDEYFVLADHREGGEDSRYFGPVKQEEIKGTVIGQFRRNGI